MPTPPIWVFDRIASEFGVPSDDFAAYWCSCFASDFVVLVLSPPRRTVLSETVLVLDGCLNCGDAER
ncbi:MAG: hypothetical protein NTV29_05105 [Planctomycetota bacterium]|nr:hypothetical protein [Planctomycetota bacterium]